MKLRAVHIHNFRAIEDVEIELSDYSLLVGPNNAGKSTVIDALRAFYEKDGFKFRPDVDCCQCLSSEHESWIELTFHLSDAEFASLAEDYKTEPNTLRVRKYFQTHRQLQDRKSANGCIFGYLKDGSLSDRPFYGAKNVQSGKFGDIIYIPAISKVDEHTKLTGPSALRDLISDIMSNAVELGSAYGDFATSVQTFAGAVREESTADNRSLARIEADLNAHLRSWETGFHFRVKTPSATDIVRSMLDWELVDGVHGKPQSVDYYGSGFQRHFIYSLISIQAKYSGKKPPAQTKDFTPSFMMVLFEEPEAFLHPPQQEQLARNLMNMAVQDDWQVLCATHSTHFVSRRSDDIPAIVRLQRVSGLVQAYQVRRSEWKSLVSANQSINKIAKTYPETEEQPQSDEMKPEMEAIRYFLWLNPARCGLFFADHVLLVEGQTEVGLINRLIGDDRIASTGCGLYILDSLGKYNLPRFMNLLCRLGIRHSVLYDDDGSRGRHAELNQLIESACDPTFTYKIASISEELEQFLGIPSAGAKYRKPQHVLYLYETGQIDCGKLDSFCELVAACLPSPVP